jgi:hypothetical protein
MRWALALLVAMSGAPSQARGAPSCLKVGATVSLHGRLISRTFAGPPGYDSVRHGDAAEVTPVLRLARPLCVTGLLGETDPTRHSIRELQVLDVHEQLDADQRAVCRRACVLTGQLVRAESGHHHTPMIIELGPQPKPDHH